MLRCQSIPCAPLPLWRAVTRRLFPLRAYHAPAVRPHVSRALECQRLCLAHAPQTPKRIQTDGPAVPNHQQMAARHVSGGGRPAAFAPPAQVGRPYHWLPPPSRPCLPLTHLPSPHLPPWQRWLRSARCPPSGTAHRPEPPCRRRPQSTAGCTRRLVQWGEGGRRRACRTTDLQGLENVGGVGVSGGWAGRGTAERAIERPGRAVPSRQRWPAACPALPHSTSTPSPQPSP